MLHKILEHMYGISRSRSLQTSVKHLQMLVLLGSTTGGQMSPHVIRLFGQETQTPAAADGHAVMHADVVI